MHPNNLKWLEDTKFAYPDHFKNCRVLELGSGFDQASMYRHYFEDCEFMGVDKIPGNGVDLVCEAKNTSFKENYYDTLVCLSMFEHDPEWHLSLSNNIPFVRRGGLFVLCWGAEGNGHHSPEPWALVPHQEVLDLLRDNNLKIIDAFFEEDRYGPDCPGCYDVLARKR